MIIHPTGPGSASRGGPDSAPPASWLGRKVRLRAVEAADRRTLAGFDRDSARDHPPQVGGYRHWAAHRAGVADSGDTAQFAIEALHGRMLVGSMWSIQADPRSDRFSYGIGIGPRHRRCGYAADAITVLLAHMFGQRRYRKCEVSIHGGNLASLSLHGVLGFREEDRVRDTEVLRGRINYLVLMGITADEFAARNPDLSASHPPVLPRRGRHWRPSRGRHWHARHLG
ncbi:GNAT family N-acetyltransferase [Allokutzneria oryzae]|uniref:GNAT family N-acetyltransferase n=1 Tax=Allokutzneria oryzae TaxID=1378989 RepID=A0ABV5ZVR7_9PSEU